MDPLDQMLREAAPYIDDAGFTNRVLRQLPARREARSLRAVILIAITLLGSVMAYVLSDGGRFVSQSMVRLTSLSPLMAVILAVSAGLVVTVGGTIAALRNQAFDS